MKGFIIPANCVHTQHNGIAVWIASNGKAHRQPITSSAFVQGGILGESGLEAGDSIICTGYQKLFEGAEIIVKNE